MKRVVIGIISRVNDNGEDEFLLIQAKKDFGQFTGFYYPPGGHIEAGETEDEAVVREIKEELNIDVAAVQKIAETQGDVEGQITYWWKCEYITGEIKVQEDEISDAGYFTKTQLENMDIWPATQKFFERYIFA